MVIAAFRFAEASLLSPLAYLELVTATLFGQLVFSELPDRLALTGIVIIVLGGLLIWISTQAVRLRAIGRL
jgi:S-adenosylmethionine uptake transporter